MRNLYEKAVSLIIWLGGSDVHSGRVVAMVRTVGRLIGEDATKAAQRAGLEELLGSEFEDPSRRIIVSRFSTMSAPIPRLPKTQDRINSYEESLMTFFDRSWSARS